MILQLSTPYTDRFPSNCTCLEPQTLVPSGKSVKTILHTSDVPTFPRLECHHLHAARQFQITQQYGRLIHSNSCTSSFFKCFY